MKVARQLAVSAGAVAAMLGLAAWGLMRTEAPVLVVHWDAAGSPDGFVERHVAFLMLPGVAAVVSLFLGAIPGLMPQRSRIERSGAAYTAVWMAALFGMLICQFVIIAIDTGVPVYAPGLIGVLVALVLFVAGNWMGKIRYNFLFGVRTPWTLADERVWDKTHRFTGRLMVLAAIVLFIASFVLPGAHEPIAPGSLLIVTLLICALGPALAGVVYSAVISRAARERKDVQ